MESKGTVLVKTSAVWVSYAHTLFAASAFLGALIVGVALHYDKIVQNEHWGYPEEWFPSVSATIGDKYPERSVFQIFIAITSGPRFALVFLTYLLTARPGALAPKVLMGAGILRTLTCGGWTYITSTDDHDWHDIFMISYMVLTIPWTAIRVSLTPKNTAARTYRVVCATLFFTTIVPLIYWFIQHKVHRKAGAYTVYAFFEWSLVLFDVAFDAGTALDFGSLEISIVDTTGATAQSAGLFATHTTPHDKGTRKHHGFGALSFVIMVVNWFVFWSAVTALPLLIWYFPLWYMGISGYEAFLVAVAAPLVLLINFNRRLYAYIPQIPYLGTLIAIAAYWAKDPRYRLGLVGLGAGFATISLAMQFWGIQARPLAGVHRASGFSLGLILSSVAKLAYSTNNPIWPIMHEENGGWNRTGLAVGLVCALLVSRLQYSADQPTSSAGKGESALAAAFGVAGLMFALHTLLCDSSTMILWAWDGYHLAAPHPVPHGALTIAAMCLGVYLGVVKRNVTGNWSAYAVGCAGAFVLYGFRGWAGYIGGLVLAVYLMSIVPVILESAGRHNPGVTFGLGMFILVLLYLAHVWIVAYAFVPGGPLLRERTDLVMLGQQVCIGLGIWAHNQIKVSPVNNPIKVNTNIISLSRRVRSHVVIGCTILCALGAAISFKRVHRDAPVPHHPESKSFTAGIWTIHFALDNDMWASEMRMANVMRELEVDVMGFLESDTQRAIGGFRDLTQPIADELGYYTDFGPGPNKHTWGAALVSKFPIVNSTHHLLPSPVGELAPAIHATLDVYGELIDVVVFHSGQEEDVEDRRLQSLGVADIMASSDRPMVLLSYLVTKPLQGNYNTYVSEYTGMRDIDSTDWDRWCQYILYKKLKRTAYARVSRSTITDTEIQVGKFVVNDRSSSDDRIDESQVPEDLRFPALFRGEGVRGHRYHVFDEPRYYA